MCTAALQSFVRVAALVLGILSVIIILSFMIPEKVTATMAWLDVQEEAEWMGLIPSSTNSSGYWRSLLAGGTGTVKKFLTHSLH